MSERRCPHCGALVAADAEWCGLCLVSLREPAPPPSTTVLTAGATERPTEGRARRPVWRCPTCEAENVLDAYVCAVCRTPFGRLFEEPGPAPAVSRQTAAAWSLVLPGLGHWLLGRRADAVARFVLAAWIGGMLIVLLSSGSGQGGLGIAASLVAVFGLAAVALWAEAVVDARRVAAGVPPVMTSRMMLWACVALVGLSILIATILASSGLSSSGAGAVG
jgi:hypothetical protein